MNFSSSGWTRGQFTVHCSPFTNFMDKDKNKSEKQNFTGDRRSFFKMLFSEVFTFMENLKDKPQITLAELWQLADKEMGKITPLVSPYAEIIVEEKNVKAKHTDRKEPFFIFDNTEENTFIFNRFNGENSIKDITEDLSENMSWEKYRSFTYIKTFYINLVSLGICIPPEAGLNREK